MKLTQVKCTGCGRRCYLHGKTHPEVTVQWSLASGYDRHGEKAEVAS